MWSQSPSYGGEEGKKDGEEGKKDGTEEMVRASGRSDAPATRPECFLLLRVLLVRLARIAYARQGVAECDSDYAYDAGMSQLTVG